jgi:hypothetical protein
MLNLARYGFWLAGLTVVASGCSGCEESETGSGGAPPATISSATTTTASTGVGGSTGSSDGGGGGYSCPDPTEGVVFALREVRFGTETPSGWKQVGMNIDGLESDGMSTDVCQPYEGGVASVVHPDGDDGIDNAFGKSLLPLINTVSPNFDDRVKQYLVEGRFNTMVKMYCLQPSGDQELLSKVFGGTDLGSLPLYDGNDVWPVAPEILSDPMDPESTTLIFENSNIVDNHFDSGPNEDFILSIPAEIKGEVGQLKLSLHAARVTMELAEDRKSATGVLAGVLNTEEVVEQAKRIAYLADICEDESYEPSLMSIRRMSDIMDDGTQDPTATCNGISFGLEFEMAIVSLGDVGPPGPVGPSCP